ncbi:hypothetical protein JCM5353_004013 [Sporobolomyces roseus]
MNTPYYDLDGDGYNDPSPYQDPYAYSSGLNTGRGGYDYSPSLPGAYESESPYDFGGGYADNGRYERRGYADGGAGGEYYDDPYYGSSMWDEGRFDLEDYTSFIDRDMPIYEAWGDDRWNEQQYAFADLIYYQLQLETDRTLDEAERMRRWEERLAWEELEEGERMRYYHSSDPYRLSCLGLSDGFWGRRFGNRQDLDLSHLRSIPLRRGLFSSPYRSSFVQYPNLGRRYQPYFSRSSFRAFQPRSSSLSSYHRIDPLQAASYSSTPISRGGSMSVRNQELSSRLRMAELRASLTSLSPADRSQAISDARHIRQLLNEEERYSRTIDRSERHQDAVLQAEEVRREQEEMRIEWEERERLRRLNGGVEGFARGGLGEVGIGGRYY